MAPPPTLKLLQSRLADCESSASRATESVASAKGDTSANSSPSLPDGLGKLLKDLLLSFRHATTSLALAFKPPLTIPAALQQLDKFIIDLCQIASCVTTAATLIPPGILLDEWQDGVLGVFSQASRFLHELSQTTFSNGSGSGKANDDNPYLHYTGMIWERIDSLAANLSETEGQAVAKRWANDTDLVKDAWTEFKESIEGMEITKLPANGEGGVEKLGDDVNDEWDDDDMMGFGSKTISEQEHETVEAIKPVLQLLQLLHAFLPRHIPSLDFSQQSQGKAFIKASNQFSALFDDLVCALYPVHSSSGIDNALSRVEEMVAEMTALIRANQVTKEGEAFLVKWEERMRVERAKWDERRLSLGGLMDSLG